MFVEALYHDGRGQQMPMFAFDSEERQTTSQTHRQRYTYTREYVNSGQSMTRHAITDCIFPRQWGPPGKVGYYCSVSIIGLV